MLTIGNFDGVHRGHVQLISRLRARADAAGAPALAVTFDPHPIALLRPHLLPPSLTTFERRIELLRQAGADEVVVFRTGPWLLGLTAREFFDRIILGQLQARGMVEGFNFAFGRDRAGNVERLTAWCLEAGLEFEETPPAHDENGVAISSSEIRGRLREGDVHQAARLLGRPHRLEGAVVHGARRGRELGFPTANLGDITVQIPARGVYAAWARIPDLSPTPLPAAVHIGPNATFGERDDSVEAHLIGFEGDLYGQRMELDLIERTRSTHAFTTVENLVAQIRVDVSEVKARLERESFALS